METTLYEQVGGGGFFERLVEGFYREVERDDALRALYPQDLTESKRHLTLFLIQYWGGPSTYMQERGHPRLRIRHAPFRITKQARDAWMTAMNASLSNLRAELSDDQLADLTSYFEMASSQMRNV
ncbi:MAG: globin [Acidimicrobiales bacterium]